MQNKFAVFIIGLLVTGGLTAATKDKVLQHPFVPLEGTDGEEKSDRKPEPVHRLSLGGAFSVVQGSLASSFSSGLGGSFCYDHSLKGLLAKSLENTKLAAYLPFLRHEVSFFS